MTEVKSMILDKYSNREAYKSIRTNLKFCGDDVKVIEFTSCVSHEGKSTVSLNIATSFADMGKKVLMVDADLRKSLFASKLTISRDVPGLVHYLSGRAKMEEVVLDTDVPNLKFIYAGATPPNPTELLAGKRFKEFIDLAKAQFDYVIIDTPPLEMVIDAAVISPMCDGVVIVIAANDVSYKYALEIKDQLVRANCRILGVVLNKADISKTGYYSKYYGKKYGKKYGYGYGYGYGYYGHPQEDGEDQKGEKKAKK